MGCDDNDDNGRLLVCGATDTDVMNISLNGNIIHRVPTEQHLGNWFGPGLLDEHFKAAINADMCNRTMLATFRKCNYTVKYKLFKSFCTAMYGSSLWDLSDKKVECVYTAWRKCLRRLLDVPPTTHCDLLPIICDDKSFDLQIHKRFLGFFEKAVSSTNSCVSLCAKLALNGSRSAACRSLNYVCEKYGVRKYSIVTGGRQAFLPHLNSAHLDESTENKCKAGAIRDLLDMKYCSTRSLIVLDSAELDFILTELCCN